MVTFETLSGDLEALFGYLKTLFGDLETGLGGGNLNVYIPSNNLSSWGTSWTFCFLSFPYSFFFVAYSGQKMIELQLTKRVHDRRLWKSAIILRMIHHYLTRKKECRIRTAIAKAPNCERVQERLFRNPKGTWRTENVWGFVAYETNFDSRTKVETVWQRFFFRLILSWPTEIQKGKTSSEITSKTLQQVVNNNDSLWAFWMKLVSEYLF